MTEMDSGLTSALPQPSALTMSCDVNQPASSPSLCANQDEDGGHHDNMKLEDKEAVLLTLTQSDDTKAALSAAQRGVKAVWLAGAPLPHTPAAKKARPKGKLVRSMAVCEDTTTPAPEICTKDQKLSSSGCYDDESTSCTKEALEKSQPPNKDVLIQESGVEYTDSSGVDLQRFISDTLNSNPRDRMALLKLERDMIDHITSNSPFKKFPQMSSYHRMLVHRVAAYFGMEHNVDQTGKAVIINRTAGTRIPEQRFLQQIREDKTEESQQWKAILHRDPSTEDQPVLHPLREKQSRSMEERQEEYYRARERIFKQEPHCLQDGGHDEPRTMEDFNPFAETQRRRQMFQRSHGGSTSSRTSSSQQSSMESDCLYEPPAWSSSESDSPYQWRISGPKRGHAGGGHVGGGTGSISLYRVQSPSIPEESPPPAPPPPPAAYSADNAIPPGSILVNPQTGQPFLNPDGTPAVYLPPDSQQPIRSQPQIPPPPLQQPQMLQYSVSYAPPSQPYSTQVEDLSSQFAHVAVSCPSTGEAPPHYPPTQSYIYAPPPPPPNQAPNYCQSAAQVPMYFYSGQTCTPTSSTQHLHSQAGYPLTMAVQPSHGQAQSMLGNYPSMAAQQCGGGQVPGSISYAQSSVGAPLGGEGGYCMGPPPCAPLAQPTHPGCFSMGAPAWGGQY